VERGGRSRRELSRESLSISITEESNGESVDIGLELVWYGSETCVKRKIDRMKAFKCGAGDK